MDKRLKEAFDEISLSANKAAEDIELVPDFRERFCRLAALNDLLRNFREDIRRIT